MQSKPIQENKFQCIKQKHKFAHFSGSPLQRLLQRNDCGAGVLLYMRHNSTRKMTTSQETPTPLHVQNASFIRFLCSNMLNVTSNMTFAVCIALFCKNDMFWMLKCWYVFWGARMSALGLWHVWRFANNLVLFVRRAPEDVTEMKRLLGAGKELHASDVVSYIIILLSIINITYPVYVVSMQNIPLAAKLWLWFVCGCVSLIMCWVVLLMFECFVLFLVDLCR